MEREPILSLREDLAGLQPYVSPQLPARYRMNTNESPYPPPESVVEGALTELRETMFNRYPERDADALFDALAEATGCDRECLWVANGSNEVLLHLHLAFGGPQRTSLTFEPTYSLHTLIARIAGTNTRTAIREDGWRVTADLASAAVGQHRPDIVMLCSPNNPTGNLEDGDALESLLANVPMVVVDEAYIEFAVRGSTFQRLLEAHPNLVIVRTFSKAWSLAGVRLGFLMAHPSLIESMKVIRLPYHLSTFTQRMGIAALNASGEGGDVIEAIRGERERLAAGIAALGLRVHPSEANFVLFEVGGDSAGSSRTQAVWQALLDKGVLVRNYASSELLSGCLRVTAGSPEETEAFLTALKEVL